MDNDLKRTIILDNYQNPKNKGLIDDDSYISINMNNESCIDEIDLMVKVDNDRIVDARFDGEACAICTSSTSIMTDILIGKTLQEAREIYKNYVNMIEEKSYDASMLESAIVYQDIAKQPNRKKCALLSWWGIDKVLERFDKDDK